MWPALLITLHSLVDVESSQRHAFNRISVVVVRTIVAAQSKYRVRARHLVPKDRREIQWINRGLPYHHHELIVGIDFALHFKLFARVLSVLHQFSEGKQSVWDSLGLNNQSLDIFV